MSCIDICGLAFIGDNFRAENAEIIIENGVIKEINPVKKSSENWIVPAFFNAHTHIADAAACDIKVDRPLAELVAPPNGLKHRILRATPDNELVNIMKSTIKFMKNTGTLGFADFREGGVHGVNLLKEAADSTMHTVILGRDGGEMISDGLGLSSAKGNEAEREAVKRARDAGKIFSVHAGEADAKDIQYAFDLNPDFIIHAVNFSDKNIKEAADKDIPIVICPRSNWTLNAADSSNKPPVRKLLDAGCRLFLGTDNAMFVEPDMAAECAFLYTVYKLSPLEIMKAACGGFEIAGSSSIIKVGAPANITVLKKDESASMTKDPLKTLFMRRSKVIKTISSLAV